MLAIIARAKAQADHFCYQNRIHPDDWRYIHTANNMRGLIGNRDVIFCRLPDWYEGRKVSEVDLIDALIREHDRALKRLSLK